MLRIFFERGIASYDFSRRRTLRSFFVTLVHPRPIMQTRMETRRVGRDCFLTMNKAVSAELGVQPRKKNLPFLSLWTVNVQRGGRCCISLEY
jgi:hypothetical protein